MRNDVVSALQSALSSVSLCRPGAVLLTAVSGGADSVALLCGLAALRSKAGFALHAVHVEHGLRGEYSLADALFVAGLCESMNVPLLLYHAKLAGDMDSPGVEARAREARRRFFAEAMEACKADALLTAHHQDDQAETVLMRLLRGAGAGGLGGMRASVTFGRGLLLRPFLSLPGQVFAEALTEMGQTWREDESNAKPCCLRNELRLSVFPELRALQPQATQHMAETAQRLQWDEDCLSAMADKLLETAFCPWPSGGALRREALLEAPKAVALRALRAWVKQAGEWEEKSLSHEQSIWLYELAVSAEWGSMNLPGELCAIRTEGYLHLCRQGGLPLRAIEALPPIPIVPSQPQYAMASVCFALTSLAPDEPLPDGRRAVLLTDALLARGLVLRAPQPGDRIFPFGAPGGKALRRYLTDHKVDAPFRTAWPVVAEGQDIHWVAGVGASQQTRRNEAEGLWKLSVEGDIPVFNKV